MSGFPRSLYPPSRMIIGEVRSEECLDLMLALNAGLPGLATIHANSPRGAGQDVHAAVAGGRELPDP